MVTHGSHFPSEHIAFMGALPRLQNPTKKILENYDLLICIGCDGLRMSVWNDTEPLPSKMPIIHIGINEWEIGKNYFTELAIIGNVKNTLHDINQYLKKTLTSKESAKNLSHKTILICLRENELYTYPQGLEHMANLYRAD